MTSSHPEDRIRLSIELALTAKDTQRQETQDAEARALGMSGAEIDAARRGRSFDAKTSIAMALAIASASGSSELAAERARKWYRSRNGIVRPVNGSTKQCVRENPLRWRSAAHSWHAADSSALPSFCRLR